MNETHKSLWNFEIPTDHLIPVRRPDIVIAKKKKKKKKRKEKGNLPNRGLYRSRRLQSENQRNRKNNSLLVGDRDLAPLQGILLIYSRPLRQGGQNTKEC